MSFLPQLDSSFLEIYSRLLSAWTQWQRLILGKKVSKLITSFQISEKVQVCASLEFHLEVLILFPFIILTWLHLDRPHLLWTQGCQTLHPLTHLLPSPCKRYQLKINQDAWTQASGMGISPWQQTLLPVGTGLCFKRNCGVGSFALATAHLLPLSSSGWIPSRPRVGKGLPNFDTKPKGSKENTDKFPCIKPKASSWKENEP